MSINQIEHSRPENSGSSTKLCHVAALALVGWYLMVPPQSLLDSGEVPEYPAKSVAGWIVKKEFKTEDECREREGIDPWATSQPPNNYNYARNPLSYAECVESNAPCLKEKWPC